MLGWLGVVLAAIADGCGVAINSGSSRLIAWAKRRGVGMGFSCQIEA
jgi:hypothetical protein